MTRRSGLGHLLRGGATFVLAVLVVLGLASSASAHTSLEGSDPADGAQLAEAPTAVRLTFSEPVLEGPNRITVTGPNGGTWQRPETLNVNGDTVSTKLAELEAAGEYTVDYRVVSVDGHPLSGSISFTFTEPAGGTSTTAAPTGGQNPGETPRAAARPNSGQTPQAAAGPGGDGGVGIWPWLAGAGVLVCALLVLLIRRGRGGSKAPTDSQ